MGSSESKGDEEKPSESEVAEAESGQSGTQPAGQSEGRSTANWQGFEDFLLEHDEDKTEESRGVKKFVSKLLHHRFVEGLIVTLVFADIILLGLESGIDHHLVCVNGHVEDPGYSQQGTQGGHDNAHAEHSGHSHATIHYSVPPAHSMLSFSRTAAHLRPRREAVRLAPSSQEGANMHQLIPKHPPQQSQQVSHPEAAQPINVDHGHGHGSADDLLVCETRDGHHAHHILHTCHMASIAILVLFLVEILLKFWIHPQKFLSNVFNIIDAGIVTLSLLIDTVVTWYIMSHSASHDSAEKARGNLTLVVAALVFVRLWRVVRIIHGLLNYIHEKSHHSAMLKQKILDHETTIHGLHSLCSKYNIEVPEHLAPPKHESKH